MRRKEFKKLGDKNNAFFLKHDDNDKIKSENIGELGLSD